MTQQSDLDTATKGLDPPFAVVDLDAFDANAEDLRHRAGGRPIRVASKSVRCLYLIERVLGMAGFEGVMAYSLREALWLASRWRDTPLADTDILVAYPTTDHAALRELATSGARISVMVDSTEHLDLIDSALGVDHPPIRVCLEFDAAWRPLPGVYVGTRRSTIRTPKQAARLAAEIVRRPGFSLVGVMSYEGQIAGLGDAPPGSPLQGAVISWMQRRSGPELIRRRSAAVAAIRAITPLEFVNGGGTGSLELTSADPSVTELAAGSGLIGPWLFDSYKGFKPKPAAFYALPVVRRPAPRIATLFAGGYVASGTAAPSRLPQPYLPAGLKLLGTEGAGEVQTPVIGQAAERLKVGDRVWMRHSKAGELAERFQEYHLVRGDRIEKTVPTYRGEGQNFG